MSEKSSNLQGHLETFSRNQIQPKLKNDIFGLESILKT